MKNKKSRIESFCRQCGASEIEFTTKYFDVKTGNPKISKACSNPKCWIGCYDRTGHDYHWFSGKCKLCGDHGCR